MKTKNTFSLRVLRSLRLNMYSTAFAKKSKYLGRIINFVLLWGLFAGPLSAGPIEKTPLPDGPWLAHMANFSAWEIDFTYAKEEDGKSSNTKSPSAPDTGGIFPPRQVTVVRTRPLWHAVIIDTHGGSTECWCEGSLHFLKSAGAESFGMVGVDARTVFDQPFLLGYDKMDFPGMEWITAEAYLGIQKLEEIPCLVFQQGGKDDCTVWINAETRQPVKWIKSGETRRFKMLPPPSEKLTLPSELAGLLQAIQHIKDVGRRQAGGGQ